MPVLANGGIPSSEEIEPCLEETGAYGVMSAEGNLYNPMLFAPHNAAAGRTYASQLPEPMRSALEACEQELDLSSPGAGWDRDHAAYAPATFLAQQYLAIVTTLPSTKTATSAIKAHLYKLFRPVWAAGRHPEMRESLGRAGGISGTMEYLDRVKEFQDWVDQFRELLKVGSVVVRQEDGCVVDTGLATPLPRRTAQEDSCPPTRTDRSRTPKSRPCSEALSPTLTASRTCV